MKPRLLNDTQVASKFGQLKKVSSPDLWIKQFKERPQLLLLLSFFGCNLVRLDQQAVGKDWVVVKLGQLAVRAELADDPEEMRQGLSGRPSLAENEGMLFLFKAPTRPVFWMRGMNFPLDFIWIRDGQVVDLHQAVPPPPAGFPDRQLARVSPEASAEAVLEVKAGVVKKTNLKIGDHLEIRY